MSLVGAVLTLSVSLIFPTACYLKMFGDELDAKEKWLNYAIVGLGFLCVGSGNVLGNSGFDRRQLRLWHVDIIKERWLRVDI